MTLTLTPTEPCWVCRRDRPEEGRVFVDLQVHGIWERVAVSVCEQCVIRIDDEQDRQRGDDDDDA